MIRLNRKRNDIKKLNVELITSEQNLEHYRQLLNKYSVSDASTIERYLSVYHFIQSHHY